MRNAMRDDAEGLLTAALEKARTGGAAGGKIHFSQKEAIRCGFENGRLKSSDSEQSISYNVEVLVDGKKGTAGGNDMGDLNDIVDRAVELGKVGAAAHFDEYPQPAETRSVRTHSASTLGLTRERMIEGCQQIVDALKSYDPDLFIEASAIRSESEDLLVTTGGVRHPASGTHWSLGAYAQRTEGTDMLFAGYSRAWGDLNEFYDPNVISEHILEDLRNGERIVPAPTGETTGFLCPEMLERWLLAIELGVNGRNVAKGDSPLRGKLGQQVLDRSVTIVDDSHRDYCTGASEIDSDGIPTRVTPIFTDGVLENFLYDLDSAGLAGAKPTGHTACRPYCPSINSGSTSSHELLTNIRDGIYIKELIGFAQSNIMNGDFSCNVALGYRIRDGEIVGRVKDTMVAGNVYDLLRDGVSLSSDRDEISRIPCAVVQGVHISTR